ncbi:hypothetical protein GCM10022384_22580 [Streptomyces marokkonensis]|uniref:Secreted protein n=1 Tax=Streptomyces marokkonensis TaxID=324855 RepID=A0ABP7PTN3_9ACTN
MLLTPFSTAMIWFSFAMSVPLRTDMNVSRLLGGAHVLFGVGRHSCGTAAGTAVPHDVRARGPGQPALQETVGQVQLPLAWMVAPQLSPPPFDLAVSVCALG